MIKIGLIGCGQWGRNYIRAVKNTPGLELKYIFDLSRPDINIPEETVFTQNVSDILSDPDIMAVIVVIPAKYLFETAKRCLEAGKNILIVRPMADSSQKALDLVRLAKERSLVLMVDNFFVYHPAIRKIKEFIDSGELGNILHIFSTRAATWPVRSAEDISVLWELGPFDISVFLYLLGREPDRINALSNSFLESGISDSASFSLVFGDVLAESNIRLLDAEKIRKLTVVGDKKIAIFDDFLKDKLKVYNKRIEFSEKTRIIDEGMFTPEIADFDPLEELCKHFLECISGNKRPITNGENGYEVLKLLEDIERRFGGTEYPEKIDKIGIDHKKGVKFVDLDRIHDPLRAEIVEGINKIIDKGDFILGDEVEEFEDMFSDFHNVHYGVGVDSGTSALELALRVLCIGHGDEVIVPANTFIATASAVTFTGARPVFVDCRKDYLIDVNKIEDAITYRTKAVIPVHLYGQACDMDEIQRIAAKHNLKVIEDSCQAHGAVYMGKRVGNFSDLACFSFYPGKNLGGMGDGGMIITNNQGLADGLKRIRNYGQTRKYHHDFIGYNRRLDTLQASILNIKLRYLDEWSEQRREIAEKYRGLLKDITRIALPLERPNRGHVYHLFVIRVSENNRDKLMDFLKGKEIDTGIHYPVPIHLQKSYRDLGYREGDFPVTEGYAKDILSLPIFPGMRDEEVEYVCDKIKEFFEG